MDMSNPRVPLKFGILGAARIAPRALIYPAHAMSHVLFAVASRDKSKAFRGIKPLNGSDFFHK